MLLPWGGGEGMLDEPSGYCFPRIQESEVPASLNTLAERGARVYFRHLIKNTKGWAFSLVVTMPVEMPVSQIGISEFQSLTWSLCTSS